VKATTVSFEHVAHLSDEIGLFEHAEMTVRRAEHGYCVDDVARGLVVTAREQYPDPTTRALSETYLRFVGEALAADGQFRNRRSADGIWRDEPGVDDCWGRALWGLGTAVARAPALAERALTHFDRGSHLRSPWSRAMAFAALGAAAVLERHPQHKGAQRLLSDAAVRIGPPGRDPDWRWPEPRLHYANAALAEAMLSAGSLLGRRRWVQDGLAMLTWLVGVETRGNHVSVTPVGRWARGELRPGFDQQPIEVAALADACALAFELTSDPGWARIVQSCAAWFEGDNDTGVALTGSSGGGCDGLERHGRNENQGAESTLALLSTLQQARRLFAAAA
jgi:hypothetical protein